MKKLSQAFLEFVRSSDIESISIINNIIFDFRNSFKYIFSVIKAIVNGHIIDNHAPV